MDHWNEIDWPLDIDTSNSCVETQKQSQCFEFKCQLVIRFGKFHEKLNCIEIFGNSLFFFSFRKWSSFFCSLADKITLIEIRRSRHSRWNIQDVWVKQKQSISMEYCALIVTSELTSLPETVLLQLWWKFWAAGTAFPVSLFAFRKNMKYFKYARWRTSLMKVRQRRKSTWEKLE